MLASPETLAEVRRKELDRACEILRVGRLHLLGYRDSGMMGTPDNAHPSSFYQASLEEATSRLVTLVRHRLGHHLAFAVEEAKMALSDADCAAIALAFLQPFQDFLFARGNGGAAGRNLRRVIFSSSERMRRPVCGCRNTVTCSSPWRLENTRTPGAKSDADSCAANLPGRRPFRHAPT